VRQLFQNLKDGKVFSPEVPAPSATRGTLVVRTQCSLVSPGTERMLSQFGKAGLIKKAQSQPDKVRQVLEKVATDGVLATAQAVRNKLDQPLPLGYSAVGTVTEVGDGVTGFSVGDRVVCNGNHAEAVVVPENLVAHVPEGVSDETASFTVLGAISMQGIRLLEPQVGERYVVIGLGVVGLLAVQILRAAGCSVLAVDLNPARVALARVYGARGVVAGDGVDSVGIAQEWSGGYGVDGVLICAATDSCEPVRQAAQMCRKRGKVVLVGVVGLELDRTEFFKKEISFQVSCSYGPGRYESNYEKKGLDYPIGFVRWTEQRNFEAVLTLMKDGKIDTTELLTSTLPFDEAPERYDGLLEDSSALGILFRYEGSEGGLAKGVLAKTIQLGVRDGAGSERAAGRVRVGVVGAGNFCSAVLLPCLKKNGAEITEIASPSGKSAGLAARKFGALAATSDVDAVVCGDGNEAVVIASRHDSHADLVCRALAARKHVFVEKPLACSLAELDEVERVLTKGSDRVLMVDFNRRFSPLTCAVKGALAGRGAPISMVMTVNAGRLPSDSWIMDEAEGGGRVISEVCHFIDLMVAVSGSLVSSISGLALRESGRELQSASFSLGFADGSIGTIHYFANGSRKVPKERFEVYSDGRTAVIENFRGVRSFGFKGLKSKRLWSQQKGHAECIDAFLRAVRGEDVVIPSWDEVRNVTRATVLAREAIRSGVAFRV